MKTIAITGGTGFVGSAILKEIQLNHKNLKANTLFRSQKNKEKDFDHVVPVYGDLNAIPENLIPNTPHVLIHFATKQIDYDNTGFDDVNINGTKNLLKQINEHTRGIIFGSTMSVYGIGIQENIKEQTLIAPETKLSISIAKAEQLIFDTTKAKNIWGVALRPRFIIGEGDKFIIPSILKLGRKRINLISGNPKFSVIDVNDYASVVVQLAKNIMDTPKKPEQKGLNIGYKMPLSFEDVLKAFNVPSQLIKLPLNGLFLDVISKSRNVKLQRLSQKIKLIGYTHFGDVTEAQNSIDSAIFNTDPIEIIEKIRNNYNK